MIMQFLDPTPEQLNHLHQWCSIKAQGSLPIQMLINHQQEWKIQGHVFLTRADDHGSCAVKFDRVSGSFVANSMGLATCKNLPRSVGLNLLLSYNQLKNLAHAPAHVGGTVNITWNPQLPMLRCLQAQHVIIHKPQFVTTESYEAMQACEAILNDHRWRGKGKTGMLNCALELKKAGLVENAKW